MFAAALLALCAAPALAALPQCLSGGDVLTPSSPDWQTKLVFPQSNQAYSPFVPTNPTTDVTAILYPATASDVATNVKCLASSGTPWTVRSGGHGYDGASFALPSPGAVVLDISRVNAIVLSADKTTVTAGAGVNLGTLYNTLNNVGKLVPAGTCPTVGLGGFIAGGGFGQLHRTLGLSIDAVLGFEVVLVDGSAVSVNATSNPDLFWALRGGGGGNFGVVTTVTMRTFDIPPVMTAYQLAWPGSQITAFMSFFTPWASAVSPALLTPKAALRGQVIQCQGLYLGSVADCQRDVVQPHIAALGQPQDTSVTQVTWIQAIIAASSQAEWDAAVNGNGNINPRVWHNRHLYQSKAWSPQEAENIQQQLQQTPNVGTQWTYDVYMIFETLGGAISKVAPADTAFPARDAGFSIQFGAYVNVWGYSDPVGTLAVLANFTESLWTYIAGLPSSTPAASYVNYLDPTLGNVHNASSWGYLTRYYGDNLPRLRAVKSAVDPQFVLMRPQGIPPAGWSPPPTPHRL